MDTEKDYYSGFEHPAEQIQKFLGVADLFTLMLKNGDVVHFTPKDAEHFREWLLRNHITDIRTENGWVIGKNK